jgi:hypothetical protein
MKMYAFEERVKRTLGPINAFRDNDKITSPGAEIVTVSRIAGYNADLNTGEKWGAFVQRHLPFAELVNCGSYIDTINPIGHRTYWATFKQRDPENIQKGETVP